MLIVTRSTIESNALIFMHFERACFKHKANRSWVTLGTAFVTMVDRRKFKWDEMMLHKWWCAYQELLLQSRKSWTKFNEMCVKLATSFWEQFYTFTRWLDVVQQDFNSTLSTSITNTVFHIVKIYLKCNNYTHSI